MTEEDVLTRLQERAPFATQAEARSALHAVLAALRSGLQDAEARALAEDLGQAWTEPLLRGGYQGELTCEELYRLTAFQGDRRLSIATEHTQIVCGVLGELLSEYGRQRLGASLPQLAILFERSVPPESPPASVRRGASSEQTLASGKPGSKRPLSDAQPRSVQLSSELDDGTERRRPT